MQGNDIYSESEILSQSSMISLKKQICYRFLRDEKLFQNKLVSLTSDY